MKKIMFNDRYGLTQAVIEGRKTMTRRIIIPQPDFLSDNFGWAKRNNGDVILPKYGVGEVVAVAQSYEQAGIQSWAYLSRPEIDGYQIISTHKGWRNKMYVSADLMPHQIRITGIRCERLQDISDEECLREGIRQLNAEPLCEECRRGGVVTPATVVDHIVPINEGGAPMDMDNLQSLCAKCHNRKSGAEAHKSKL